MLHELQEVWVVLGMDGWRLSLRGSSGLLLQASDDTSVGRTVTLLAASSLLLLATWIYPNSVGPKVDRNSS